MPGRKKSKKKRPLKPEEIKMLEGVIEGKTQKQAFLDAYPDSTAKEPRKAASRKMREPQMQEALEMVVQKSQERSIRALVKLQLEAEENIDELTKIAKDSKAGAANRVGAYKFLIEKGLPPERKILEINQRSVIEATSDIRYEVLLNHAARALIINYLLDQGANYGKIMRAVDYTSGPDENPKLHDLLMNMISRKTEELRNRELTREELIPMCEVSPGRYVAEIEKKIAEKKQHERGEM